MPSVGRHEEDCAISGKVGGRCAINGKEGGRVLSVGRQESYATIVKAGGRILYQWEGWGKTLE